MDRTDAKLKIKIVAKTALNLLEDDCNILPCDNSCPYFIDHDIDDISFHCIIVQAQLKLEQIIERSGSWKS